MPPPKSSITLSQWRKKCTTKVPAVFHSASGGSETFSEEKVSETFKKTLIRFAVDNPTFSTGLEPFPQKKVLSPAGATGARQYAKKALKGFGLGVDNRFVCPAPTFLAARRRQKRESRLIANPPLTALEQSNGIRRRGRGRFYVTFPFCIAAPRDFWGSTPQKSPWLRRSPASVRGLNCPKIATPASVRGQIARKSQPPPLFAD